MRSNVSVKVLASAAILCGVNFGDSHAALANTPATTIESSVVVENSADQPDERVVQITGPDKVVYRIEASPAQTDEIIRIARQEPQTVLSFNGQAQDVNGEKVFKVENWKKVTTTTKSTTSDSLGNRTVEEKTETRTE